MTSDSKDTLLNKSRLFEFSSSSVHFWSNSSNSLQNIFRSFKSTKKFETKNLKKFEKTDLFKRESKNNNECQNRRCGSCESTRNPVLTTIFPVNKIDDYSQRFAFYFTRIYLQFKLFLAIL